MKRKALYSRARRARQTVERGGGGAPPPHDDWFDAPRGPGLLTTGWRRFRAFLDRRGLYLEDVYITPAHRGRGLGGWVLKHLAALAVELGCGRFEWVVLDWNENAIEFYKHHGGEILDDWRVVRVTGDALLRLAGQA